MPAINIARRDPSPKVTFRRVRGTIELLSGKQPREVLEWIVKSISPGNIGVNAGWRDVQVIIERARVALAVDGNGDDDATLVRALDEIMQTCNYHLDAN